MVDELTAMATRITAKLVDFDERRRRVGREGMKALELLDPVTAPGALHCDPKLWVT